MGFRIHTLPNRQLCLETTVDCFCFNCKFARQNNPSHTEERIKWSSGLLFRCRRVLLHLDSFSPPWYITSIRWRRKSMMPECSNKWCKSPSSSCLFQIFIYCVSLACAFDQQVHEAYSYVLIRPSRFQKQTCSTQIWKVFGHYCPQLHLAWMINMIDWFGNTRFSLCFSVSKYALIFTRCINICKWIISHRIVAHCIKPLLWFTHHLCDNRVANRNNSTMVGHSLLDIWKEIGTFSIPRRRSSAFFNVGRFCLHQNAFRKCLVL